MPINFILILNGKDIVAENQNLKVTRPMNIDTYCSFLETKNPLQTLESICEANLKALVENRIALRIVSNSGYVTVGFPVRYTDEISIVYNVSNDTISYLNNRDISLVEVSISTNAIAVLTSEEYFEILNNEVPSRLELNRKLKELSVKFTELYGITVRAKFLEDKAIDDKIKYTAQKVLEILERHVTRITEDSLGKTSVKSLSAIVLDLVDEAMVVTKEANQLSIKLNLFCKVDVNFENELKQKIESIL